MACVAFTGTPAGGFKLCGVGNKLADFPRLLTYLSSFYRIPRNAFLHIQEPGINLSPLGPERGVVGLWLPGISLVAAPLWTDMVKWSRHTFRGEQYEFWDEFPGCDGFPQIYTCQTESGWTRASEFGCITLWVQWLCSFF